MVKKRIREIVLLAAVIAIMVFTYRHMPIVSGDWTKQTLYLWGLNLFHIQDKNAKPRILLIDDDSGDGIYSIKQLCEELHMKATFAVIPSMMSQEIKDSLIHFQKQGYSIALHGYNHNDWRMWSYENVINDIEKCEEWLAKNDFSLQLVKYIVAPHGSNTKAIRQAIQNKGYQMVTGANITNLDSKVFQLGRIMITKDTNLGEVNALLKKAKERRLFVIIGTHSSISDEFSTEKTKAVLQMAKDIGLNI